MKRRLVRLVLPLACVSAAACASGAGPMFFQTNLGLATPYDVTRMAQKILNQYQYEIEIQEANLNNTTIQTRWHGRYPLDDEIDQGVVEAMTRIRITGRPRVRRGSPSEAHNIRFTAENMVRFADSNEWERGFMTPGFREYIEEIANELRTELQTGVRVF